MTLRPLLTRILVELLRVPGRTYPIPGWFPLVVEGLHRRFGPRGRQEAIVYGMRMELDVDEYVQRRIYYHCHETSEARWVRRFLRPGDSVLDVGANVGFFALLAAERVGPGGRVVALEPVPQNADALERNKALNSDGVIELRRVAAGDAKGEITLGLPFEDGASDGVSGHYTAGGAFASFTVPVERVDALCAQSDRLRLVKIDVEGMEPLVFGGMTAMLERSRPDAILFEVNPRALHRSGFTAQDMFGPLNDAGYRLRRIRPSGRTGGPVKDHFPPPDSDADVAPGRWRSVVRGIRGSDRIDSVLAIAPDALAVP